VLMLVSDPLVGEHLLNQVLSLADNQLSYDARSKYDSLKANRITRLLKQKQTLEVELLAKRNDEITRLEEADQLALRELEEQLKIKTASYFEDLSDRMKSLEEAIAIAKSLNLVEPVALDHLVRKNERLGANQVVEVVSASKDDPLYMRGTRLLSAELGQLRSRPKDYMPDPEIKKIKDDIEALRLNNQVEILKSRKSDESFNETLQSIREELAKLQAESFPDNLQFQFANGRAIAGSSPIKPKKLLILALSVVIGGLVGIVVALVNSTRKKRQAAA
jgi:LPS O-antigen subunit length determinant protein (WzzB/FepE family)